MQVSVDRTLGKKKKLSLVEHVRKYFWLYLFVFPAVLYIFIFHYLTLYGLIIAFQDFSFIKGIRKSPFVGVKHFELLLDNPGFWRVLRNSLTLSFMRLFFNFPAPILLALLLNELTNLRYKKFVQTVVYLPHFISWVVVAGMAYNLLGPTEGVVNIALRKLGIDAIPFLGSNALFRQSLLGIEIWKGIGWGSIVYLSAITSVDPALYEAAKVDGAGRWRCMWNITLPSIRPTIMVMLILRMGSLINNGFEQIYLLYNPMVYDVADVLETYIYRLGLQGGRYSYTTAIGLFKSLVSFVMVFSTNAISRKISGSSIY